MLSIKATAARSTFGALGISINLWRATCAPRRQDKNFTPWKDRSRAKLVVWVAQMLARKQSFLACSKLTPISVDDRGRNTQRPLAHCVYEDPKQLLSSAIYQGTHESKTFRQCRKHADGIFANDLACRRIDFLDQLISGVGIHAKSIRLPGIVEIFIQ